MPENEAGRLRMLKALQLPDTVQEAAFDDLTALAAEICETPIALITILDETRQWFKSRVGLQVEFTPREQAFCNYTICRGDLFIVPDALAEKRFAQNPLVTGEPHIRFYAAAPLITPGGFAVGTLCVIDHVPRKLTEQQRRTLRVLSRHVAAQLELRRLGIERREAEAALAVANTELERRVARRTTQLQIAVRQAETAKQHIWNMVERMSDGMVALDPQWCFDYVNSKAGELLGLDPMAMLGKRVVDVFPTAEAQPAFQKCLEAVRHERPEKMEAFYEKRGIWLEARCYPSREGVSIFFQDITNRKKAEHGRDHERTLSDTIINSLPGTFYLFDEHGDYIRWNDVAEAMTGRVGDDFRRAHPLETIAPEDRPVVEAGIRKTFESGAAMIEARLRHHVTGQDRWHLLTGRYIGLDDRRCLVGVGIDISERKAAEQQLNEARSRLEVAVRASGIGFWSWEVATNLFYLSPEFKSQLGFVEETPPDDYRFWQTRVHAEDLPRVLETLSIRAHKPAGDFELEYRMLHRDGDYRWMLSRSRLTCDAAGRPERMLGCHIDITERRATEEALWNSRAQLRALAEHLHSVREEEAGRIARELHDEMGSALTALKMDLGWVDRQLAKIVKPTRGEPLHARLSDINRQVDGTLDSMRKVCHALRPAVLDQLGLAAAIDWQCAEFQGRTGIRCKISRDESFGLADAKRTAIFRILQELLTNVTRHARATEVTVSARRDDQAFHLSVADNGCGLPEDAFARNNSFGLVGIRERALAAEGSATFEPTPGGGTTVKICIPMEHEKGSRG
ncbi:MAG TPA: PAS domain S-box protein [Chthoniobacteraceae bacterium]|nr:PAS domain S-box protein [Chthoniobacteraceae bacterium]